MIPQVRQEATSPSLVQVSVADSWRAATMLVSASAIVVLLLFWGTTASMVATWYRSATFSHCFLVLPISLALMWTRRLQVLALQPSLGLWALPLLSALAFAWLIADAVNVLVVQQFALVAMLPALVWLLLGTAAARRFLFPLLFLFFAVPAGEVLVPPLQDFTAWFTVEALRLSGIPVLLEGRYLMVPSATWEVAEACSGVRYLISMIALGSVFAWVAYRSWQRRALFLLAAMLVPLLANGLRAYGIVVLGYLTDNRIAVGVDHLIYGWVFFGAVGAFLFTVGWHWHEPSMHHTATPGPARTVIHPAATARTPLAPGLAAALAALALVGWAPLTAAHLQSAVAVAEISAPSVLPPWRPADHVEGWQPTFVGATAEVLQAYEHEEQWVHLFVAYYASEQQGAELVSSMNHLFDRKHWRPLGDRTVTISVDGQLCRAEQTVIRSRHGTRVLWSWYSVAGTCTSNSVAAKLLQAKAWLLRDPRAGALVAVSTASADQEAAARTLQDFLNHVSLATVFRHS